MHRNTGKYLLGKTMRSGKSVLKYAQSIQQTITSIEHTHHLKSKTDTRNSGLTLVRIHLPSKGKSRKLRVCNDCRHYCLKLPVFGHILHTLI